MKYIKVADHLTFVKVLNPSRIGLYPVHLHKFPIIKKIVSSQVSVQKHIFWFVLLFKLFTKSTLKATQTLHTTMIIFSPCWMNKSLSKQRTEHYIPSNALSISVWVGRGLFLRSVYMDITIPGVQNPHWDPWDLAILSWCQ